MSDVRQKVDRLRDGSDALLAEMAKLKALEQEKRRTAVSSARFDELAGEIEESSRKIFHLAAEERAIGDSIG